MAGKRKASGIEEPIEGKYVNYFKVGFNADVFVFDQFQVFGDDPHACTEAHIARCPRIRTIASPMDAKQLLQQLAAAVAEYEKTHGDIPALKA
ncbi:DUF3467 domain-containing protein [Desulfatitalea alkaliphila]|uniref:DUF3467 domain-containing protein n=1 Tax=Desulfatitalea alkaliphila TaxID=2929485 RepID=A0AA41UQT6_9BACT|nr:DUF3467 domain-containing protein [Desulfatitalea alkaliphila]MCJ8501688.1 DUF3467 domain-containing protein [Desulfatitalea alkaliphila]